MYEDPGPARRDQPGTPVPRPGQPAEARDLLVPVYDRFTEGATALT